MPSESAVNPYLQDGAEVCHRSSCHPLLLCHAPYLPVQIVMAVCRPLTPFGQGIVLEYGRASYVCSEPLLQGWR